MLIRKSLIALALSAALLAGCGNDEQAPAPVAATPAAAKAAPAGNSATDSIAAQVAAFRNNDLRGFINAAVPPKEIDKLRADWETKRAEPITDEERQEFADNWGKLAAPGGVDALMAEAEPQLIELKPQLPGLIAMGQGMLSMSIQQSEDLSPEQKAQATAFINGLGGWLNTTDFTDAGKLRTALTAISEGMRATGITTLDEMRALSFDDMLVKFGPLVGGVKNALNAYGLSLDTIADSVKTEVVSESGDSAKVKITYDLFGNPLSTESELVKVDGRWYGKDTLEHLAKQEAEEATESTEAGAAN